MTYTRSDLETIGEAFTANTLLEWSGRLLAAANEDLAQLRIRGVTPDLLLDIEIARMDVARLKALRKGERRPDPSLAKARRAAIEEAIDWRIELRGLAQAVFDSQPALMEKFRPGIKVSRSIPLLAAEVTNLLAALRECGDPLEAVGVTGEFVERGRDLVSRLQEASSRLEEERSLTPQTTLDLNYAKGVLYTRARFVCRLARVELRHEPSRAARYGYALLRRGVLAPRR
jgi:hypothetical protein